MEARSQFWRLANHDDADTRIVMGDDPRLPSMPEKPTLIDFFKLRFSSDTQHLLQSARLAKLKGHSEKVITACLLHDIAVVGFIRGDHGYWGEFMIAPYVDPEIAWAVRVHQALRFYPDASVGYAYPNAYQEWFGDAYKPDPYIEHEWRQAQNHKWHPTATQIILNDIYSFDSNVDVELDDFADIIGRNFKQPEQGLGFDNSPCAHLWRSIIRPNKFL
jgi:hypothetical protein